LCAETIAAALRGLRNIDAQQILLRWANYHIHHATRQGVPYIRNVANFKGDLRDGVSLVMLMKRLAPSLMGDLHTLDIEIDPQPRIEAVLEAAAALKPLQADTFTSKSHILRGDSYCNAAFMGALFMAQHGLNLIAPFTKSKCRADVPGDAARKDDDGQGEMSAFTNFGQAPFTESPLAGDARMLVAESRALVTRWEVRQWLT